MSFQFGDGWDCYATTADLLNGYWDSNVGSLASMGIGTGRFSGSRAVNFGAGIAIVKSSAVNDGVHHFVCAFQQTAAITGSTLATYFQLFDATTAQCSVVFRSDGAILLVNGGPTGTVQATYTGAFPVVNTWYAFEIEVAISNTAGYMNVRKNGNTVNDFTSATNLDTQNSANAYANKLQFGAQSFLNAQWIDDLYWRSDASAVPWLGDIRCYTRMPASDAAVQFSRAPTSMFAQGSTATSNTFSLSANVVRAVAVVAPTTGIITSLSANFNAGITGHAKMAVYDNTGIAGGPGALLGSSAELTNPGAGVNVFSVTGGPTVTRGTTYYVALWSDIPITGVSSAGTPTYTLSTAYTTLFPPTMGGFTGPASVAGSGSNGMTVAGINAGCVNEPQQDATTSYVYSSTPGHADLYGIAPIASTPLVTHAVTTRAYAIKSDAGTRTMAVQLKSGGTTVASSTVVLTPSNWQWAWRTDTTDPATGAAWSAAAVNVATIGPLVVA